MAGRPATVPAAFLARVELTPRATFLRWNDRSWSYAESLECIQSVGAAIESLCPSETTRIAAYLPNIPEHMWTWLATMFCGRIFVPINSRQRGSILHEQLQRSKAGVLLTDATGLQEVNAELLPGLHAVLVVTDSDTVEQRDSLQILRFEHVLKGAAAAWSAPRQSSADETACIMHTSGTTGGSKAVMVLHHQYVWNAARLVDAYELRSSDVFHNWLPLCHLAGQLHMTMTAVLAGGTVVLRPTFSTSSFRQEIRRYKCTVICGFTSILNFIWSLPPEASDATSSLRVGIFAGIPPELHAPFELRFGMRLGENYGMTEIDPVTCPEPGIHAPLGSCGRASPDVDLRIVDESNRTVAPGTLGRIAVKPLADNVMMAGYAEDPAATAHALGSGEFVTGDYGVMDADGFLYFRGRAAHYIRRRGENISVTEIESIIATHPAVAECAAVGVPSAVGEEDVKLTVALREGYEVAPEDIVSFARARMASFMIPRFIEIVDTLPRGELGKVNLFQLRQVSARTWDAVAANQA